MRTGTGTAADGGWLRNHRVGFISGALGLLTALLALVQPLMTIVKPDLTVKEAPVAAGVPGRVPVTPDGGSEIDQCLIGRWSAVAYRKTFVVDDVTVVIQLVSGQGFSLSLRADGTGTESLHTRPTLRGTAGGYTVVLQEAGMSELRFGEHDGVLTFAYGTTTYDFRLTVNGEEIPDEDIESTTEYTATYTCSPTRLVVSTDSNRVEYARD